MQNHLVYSASIFNYAKQVPGWNSTSAVMEMAVETLSLQRAKNKYQPLFPFTMVTWRKYSLMLNMNLEEAVQEKVHIATGKQDALL